MIFCELISEKQAVLKAERFFKVVCSLAFFVSSLFPSFQKHKTQICSSHHFQTMSSDTLTYSEYEDLNSVTSDIWIVSMKTLLLFLQAEVNNNHPEQILSLHYKKCIWYNSNIKCIFLCNCSICPEGGNKNWLSCRNFFSGIQNCNN